MNTTEQEPRALVAICPSCKALHAVTYPHMIADPAQRACAVEEFNDARAGRLRIAWMSRAEAQALTPCQPGGCDCERKTLCPVCTLPSAMCACPDAPGWSEDGCMVVHCPDPIIAANIREMAGRSVVGIGKYQKMLTRTDLSPKEWFTHHRTELMDAMGYNRKLEGIYDDLQQANKELAEDNARKADRIAELETQRTETMADYKRQAERIAELETMLEEREWDMHARIRANYDSTVADCWKAEVAKKDARIAELEAVMKESDDAMRLLYASSQRAIKRWQEATGRELVWPDHSDLCVWLMGELDKVTPDDGWRDASKEKPEEGRQVYVMSRYGTPSLQVWRGGSGWTSHGLMSAITHWRELPAPPKGEEGE